MQPVAFKIPSLSIESLLDDKLQEYLIPSLDFSSFDFGGSGVPSVPEMSTGPNFVSSPLAPNAPAAPSAKNSSHQNNNKTGAAKTNSINKIDTSQQQNKKQKAKKASSKGKAALEVARNEIGVKEIPKGSNRGPRVDQYQDAKGQYWCAHFVSWCFEQSGGSPFGHKGWVEGLRRWAKSKGVYIPASEAIPESGDIFTMARYDKKGKLVGGHTGFVDRYNAKTRYFTSIEGNSKDSVKSGRRSLSSIDGIIRL